MSYSLETYAFPWHYVAEVLKDGEPFNAENELERKYWGKKHFRFGVEKAKLIIEAINFIKHFLDLYEKISGLSMRDKKQEFENCYAEICDDYQPKGDNIFPYVLLTSKMNSRIKIGFGKVKSEALFSLRIEISKFIELYGI